MSIISEFKEFALKGNVIDLAVGVIIGGAFGKIVSSLTEDLILPVVGLLMGKLDFSNLFIPLDTSALTGGKVLKTLAEAKAAGVPTLNIGLFLNHTLDFIILAFAIFMVIKQLNRLKKPVVAEVTTKTCNYCLSEIPLKATKCAHCASELPA
jgi:large conductance mechanosensitive channel